MQFPLRTQLLPHCLCCIVVLTIANTLTNREQSIKGKTYLKCWAIVTSQDGLKENNKKKNLGIDSTAF